ncbi:AMP-binding enzyme domain-containing protein [Trichoderma breve]|uniref:AMP-binding enzyme domain-containing protein n=1 Tax=Trichoderma breve TaxID=2034170 RepID=A0A9W9B803_9HYPO|nr:AMP-binding enzyme domain-containing protein [Trichoderma breve]KAJ4858308.1 AMP-binding enzyme domain-containing protein [Trichoderma breve]
MPFTTPPYIHKLPFDPPDSIPIHEFLFNDGDKYGRYPIADSRPPFTCGITGKSYSAVEVKNRIEWLSAALASELGFEVNGRSEFDKVIALFSVNTIDTMTISWAAHRFSGVSSPISPSYSATELAKQLKAVKCKALFTCATLLPTALEAASAANIPKTHVYLLEIPEKALKGAIIPTDIKSLKWEQGQGASQTAFLCSSSGTSGLPKNVKISHRNVIANTLQMSTYESNYKSGKPESLLAVLPMSHSYALIVTGHSGVYRGYNAVVLPGFDLVDVLEAVQKHSIETLWMVPPMIVALIKNSAITARYNLEHVKTTVVGASNLTKEVNEQFARFSPNCQLIQGYGLTETSVVVSMQNKADVMFGSCGHIFPGYEGRLISRDGEEVTELDTPGELLLRSPSVMLGYLDNKKATKETFTSDGWLRTGDLMEFRKSDDGYEHLFIVDRVKEMIKVRGLQISPTEVEALLLRHPCIADVCVVPISDDSAGELPLAFIVRSPAGKKEDERLLKQRIHTFVNSELSEYKRLAGGIEFLEALPKSASGKTKRGEMKERAKKIFETGRAKALPKVLQVYVYESSDDEDSEDDE